jgi:nucleoside-diphosphate-sugar epimerase
MTPEVDAALRWYSGKRVLVTGGGGFIGSRLIGQLAGVDCRIIRLVRRAGAPAVNPGSSAVEEVIGDARDPVLWRKLPDGIDVVFHLAGQTSTYEANRDPVADLQSNVLPMLLMLQACRARDLHPVVVLASTATICGLPVRLPVDETHPDAPVTVYDLHKQMAENYLKFHVRSGMGRGAVLRLANVYGPGPRSSKADRGILNRMTERALQGEALTIYGLGEQMRDYVHVDDVARAFLQAAVHVDALNGEHYIIGRGEGTTIAQALRMIAERVAARTGRRVAVTSVEPPAGLSPIEARNFVGDTRRFCKATGWRAQCALPQGIDGMIEGLL